MNRRSTIGFDRKLELEWLDFTAAKAAEGATEEELRAQLLSYLDSISHGNEASGSARSKTALVLMRIWGNVGPRMASLHKRALQLLPGASPPERLGLHWALTIAAYPFFADHAAAVGRLISLQESVTTVQIQRRIAEQWGERSTVFRTSRHVIRTIIAWGVLEDAGKGVYRRRGERHPIQGEIAQLLLEAILLNTEQDMLPIEQVSKHPALFPFDVRVSAQELRQSNYIHVYRQGVDTEIVALAR